MKDGEYMAAATSSAQGTQNSMICYLRLVSLEHEPVENVLLSYSLLTSKAGRRVLLKGKQRSTLGRKEESLHFIFNELTSILNTIGRHDCRRAS